MPMPATPLHYCAAYIINKAKVRFILPALIVGSFIPDIEPFVSLATGERLAPRGFLHSLLGAATLDTFLAVLVTSLLYPVIVSWIFKLQKNSVSEKCRFSSMLVLSALIGSLSHVLIDATSHEYNPLLYPFVTESFDALVLIKNDWLLASVIVQITLLVLLLLILVREFKRGSEGFWRRLLVE